jgi:hypothetical protein
VQVHDVLVVVAAWRRGRGVPSPRASDHGQHDGERVRWVVEGDVQHGARVDEVVHCCLVVGACGCGLVGLVGEERGRGRGRWTSLCEAAELVDGGLGVGLCRHVAEVALSV